MSKQENRRQFLQTLGVAVGTAALLPLSGALVGGCTKKDPATSTDLPEGQKALTMTDPVATALGYQEDATKVDTTKFPKRAGVEGSTQFCNNCAQYTAVNAGWGRCNIFPQGLVKSQGWCNTWTIKS